MSPDRVLVVEDDTEIAALLAGGLTAEGYHVDLADCAAGLDQRLRDGAMTWSCWTGCCPTATAPTCAMRSARPAMT